MYDFLVDFKIFELFFEKKDDLRQNVKVFVKICRATNLLVIKHY